jgi:hypothetical protein
MPGHLMERIPRACAAFRARLRRATRQRQPDNLF